MKPEEKNGKTLVPGGPPHPMGCDEIQAVLFDYMSHELGAARSELVHAHLRKCNGCRAAATEIAKTLELLKEVADDDQGLATQLSGERRERIARAVMHPVLDWIYCHHILVSILTVIAVMAVLALVLRQTRIWREDLEALPPVIIGPPPAEVMAGTNSV